jgi:hypothetical protein
MLTFKQYILEQESIPDTITIKGKERPTKNSLGKLISTDIKSIENFWKWFGDSKIVDKQSRPLVVYHGTNSNFDAFEISNPKSVLGSGFYFSQERAKAESYANKEGANIIPVYLKSDNPFEFRYETVPDWYMSDDIKSEVLAHGYDGQVLISWGEMQEIVVYHPNQIKSAIGNNGNFSLTSIKMTESNK